MPLIDRLRNIDFARANIQLVIVSGTKDEGDTSFYRAEVSVGAIESFRHIARGETEVLLSNIDSANIQVRNYEPIVDPNVREIEVLPIEGTQIAEIIAQLNRVEDMHIFTADDDVIRTLRFYSIVVLERGRQPVHFITQFTSKAEMSQKSKSFVLWFQEGTYDIVTDKTFLFDRRVDCIVGEDEALVLSKGRFHQIFRYYEQVRLQGQESLAAIREMDIIDNFADFDDACNNHLIKLAKLNNIVSKGYLQAITITEIEVVVARLGVQVTISERGGVRRLQFDRASAWTILKLLDDDYYESELTHRRYEASSKRVI